MASPLMDVLTRRIEIYFYILKKHETHYAEIMQEFGISSRTLARDIRFISDEIAKLETKPGKSGGIRIVSDKLPPIIVKMADTDASAIVELYNLLDKEEIDSLIEQKDRFMESLHQIIRIFARRDFCKELEGDVF